MFGVRSGRGVDREGHFAHDLHPSSGDPTAEELAAHKQKAHYLHTVLHTQDILLRVPPDLLTLKLWKMRKYLSMCVKLVHILKNDLAVDIFVIYVINSNFTIFSNHR